MDIYKDMQKNIWEYYDKKEMPYSDTEKPGETLNEFFTYMYRLTYQLKEGEEHRDISLSHYLEMKNRFANNTVQFVGNHEYKGFHLKWYNERSVAGLAGIRMSTGVEIEVAVF
jgi:hypothetical protein